MRVRKWATVWLVAVTIIVSLGTVAHAQYDDALPAGLQQITVDGQPIDASTTPEVATLNPEFAGRFDRDAGVTTVEIGVGNGEIVRFPLEVSAENGRFRGTAPEPFAPGAYSLYINDALVGEFVIADDAAAGGTADRLDLASLVALPFDLEEAYPGLGVVDGRYYSVEDEAIRSSAQSGDSSREAVDSAAEQLRSAGFAQRYDNRIAAPNADNPTQFDALITNFAIEYETAENAEAGYDSITGQSESTVDDAETIGDESEIVRGNGVTSDTGAAYRLLNLTYRLDRVLARIQIVDLLNREPDLAVVEALGQALQERTNAALAGDFTGLSPLALTINTSRAGAVREARGGYEVFDGQLIPTFNEEAELLAQREATNAGTSDVYSSSLVVDLAASDDDPGATPEAAAEASAGSVAYFATLSSFSDAEAAQEWLFGLPERLDQDPLPGYLSFAVDDEAPALGEASVAYSFDRRSGEEAISGYRYYVQVESTVAAIELGGTTPQTLDDIQPLMEAQLACITAGSCPEQARLPGTGGGEGDGQGDGGGGRTDEEDGAAEEDGEQTIENGSTDADVDGGSDQAGDEGQTDDAGQADGEPDEAAVATRQADREERRQERDTGTDAGA